MTLKDYLSKHGPNEASEHIDALCDSFVEFAEQGISGMTDDRIEWIDRAREVSENLKEALKSVDGA